MNDDIGVYTKLDHLPPTEKMRDSKRRVAHQEPLSPKKERKRGQALAVEEDQEKEERPANESEGQHPGKILDIVI